MSEKVVSSVAQKNFCRLLYLLPATLPRRGQAGGKGFTYRYVKLDDLIDCLKQTIRKSKLDLSLIQKLASADGKAMIETLFISSDSSAVSSGPLVIEVSTAEPQKFGAAVTYMRRYQLQSFLGLAGEDDTDGY